MADINPIIGIRIRERREALNLSQEELADRVGYSSKNKKSTISKIENGNNDLKRSKVILFAEALQTSPSYLMGWTDNPDLDSSNDSPIVIAANTASLNGDIIILHKSEKDEIKDLKRRIADKILNSDLSEEKLDKIEKMIELILD